MPNLSPLRPIFNPEVSYGGIAVGTSPGTAPPCANPTIDEDWRNLGSPMTAGPTAFWSNDWSTTDSDVDGIYSETSSFIQAVDSISVDEVPQCTLALHYRFEVTDVGASIFYGFTNLSDPGVSLGIFADADELYIDMAYSDEDPELSAFNAVTFTPPVITYTAIVIARYDFTNGTIAARMYDETGAFMDSASDSGVVPFVLADGGRPRNIFMSTITVPFGSRIAHTAFWPCLASDSEMDAFALTWV